MVLLIALILFGPKRIPELGQSLGKGIREFKASLEGNDQESESTAPGTGQETRAKVAETSMPRGDAPPDVP